MAMDKPLVSDEEVQSFMEENYNYKPRLEDFMLDLMDTAPMLMGFPMMISKPSALKQLRKTFMQLGRENVGKARELMEEILSLRTENPMSTGAAHGQQFIDELIWVNKKGKTPRTWTPQEFSAWKTYMKGLKNTPQQLLDPLDDLFITNNMEHGGMVRPHKKNLEVTTEALMPKEVLPHELTHVEDLKGHFGLDYEELFNDPAVLKYMTSGKTDLFDVVPDAETLAKYKDAFSKITRKGFYEGKAYETGQRLSQRLLEGPVSYDEFLKAMEDSELEVINRFGQNPTEEEILRHYVPGFGEDPMAGELIIDEDLTPDELIEQFINRLRDLQRDF